VTTGAVVTAGEVVTTGAVVTAGDVVTAGAVVTDGAEVASGTAAFESSDVPGSDAPVSGSDKDSGAAAVVPAGLRVPPLSDSPIAVSPAKTKAETITVIRAATLLLSIVMYSASGHSANASA